MSISEIKLVAFGNPNRDDNAYKILSTPFSLTALEQEKRKGFVILKFL